VVVTATFASFVLGSLYLGGDALNGYVRDGHYFVCAHGSCGEVTHTIWRYSYCHAVAALGGVAVLFMEFAVLINTGHIKYDVVQK
jgi:hypothetical protein